MTSLNQPEGMNERVSLGGDARPVTGSRMLLNEASYGDIMRGLRGESAGTLPGGFSRSPDHCVGERRGGGPSSIFLPCLL